MIVKIKDNTQQSHIMIEAIDSRLYITPDLWVSTTYGQVKVGVKDGPVYYLQNNTLVEVKEENRGS